MVLLSSLCWQGSSGQGTDPSRAECSLFLEWWEGAQHLSHFHWIKAGFDSLRSFL